MDKFEQIESFVRELKQPDKVNFACRYIHAIVNNRSEPQPKNFNLTEKTVAGIYLQISKIVRS